VQLGGNYYEMSQNLKNGVTMGLVRKMEPLESLEAKTMAGQSFIVTYCHPVTGIVV
jgi:hypothetical protein